MVNPVKLTRAAVAACSPGYWDIIEMIALGWNSFPAVTIFYVSTQCANSSWYTGEAGFRSSLGR
jgi:hypothetical protein